MTVIVDSASSIETNGSNPAVSLSKEEVLLLLDGGSVATTGAAPSAIFSQFGGHQIFQVSGLVKGTALHAIDIWAGGNSIEVSGEVYANPVEDGGYGIRLRDFQGGGNNFVTNYGVISGFVGISHDVQFGNLTVSNYGTIIGFQDDQAAAIASKYGADSVVNAGHIIGNVDLGEGNDFYEGSEGTIEGKILLGAGNDYAIGNTAADHLEGGPDDDTLVSGGGADFIDGGDGFDTARLSSASLGTVLQNVERVEGGIGDDIIEIAAAAFESIVEVDGSSGIDRLLLTGDAFDLTGREIVSVEEMTLSSHAGTQVTVDKLNNLLAFRIDATRGAADEIVFTGDTLNASLLHLLVNNGFERVTDLAGTVSRPSDIGLEGQSIAELSQNGSEIGTLSAADDDAGDTHKFELLSDGGGRFEIKNGKLVVKNGVALDYEQAKSHVVKIRVADSNGLFRDKEFAVDVKNKPVEVTAGSTFNDAVIAGSGRDSLRGGAGNDALKSLGNIDTLRGDAGNDKLFGGLSRDTLFGGTGKDIFVFDTAPSRLNVDTVRDFNVRDDSFWLDNAVMKGIGSGTAARPLKIASKFFHIGAGAHDGDDRIIYNNATGKLLYDSDGDGARAEIQIAQLAKNLKLTVADFFVI